MKGLGDGADDGGDADGGGGCGGCGGEIETAVADFLRQAQARGLSRSTVNAYGHRLVLWVRFCRDRAIRDLIQVTRESIDEFLFHLATQYGRRSPYRRGERLSPRGRAEVGRGLWALLGFLVGEGRLLASPVAGIRPPRGAASPLPRCVTSEEFSRLVATLAGDEPLVLRDRALVEMLFGCGLRRAEMAALDLDELDLAAGHLVIRTGKGGRSRVVPLAGEAHRALLAYLDQGRPRLVSTGSGAAVFVSWRGRRLSGPVVGWRVAAISRRVPGLGRLSPHAFRHGFATALLRGGANVREVQLLLGHACMDTTQRYTHLNLTDLIDVYRRTHPRGGGELGAGGKA